MSGFILDLICYGTLLVIWFLSSRVKAATAVTVKVKGRALKGPILQVDYSLSSRVGLLNTPSLAAESGLLLLGVKSIHTLGMRYDIDVVFLDEQNRILHATEVAKGTRQIKGPKGTKATLELAVGAIQSCPELKEHFLQIEVSRDGDH